MSATDVRRGDEATDVDLLADAALVLVSTAITAKIAAQFGAPRLATAAARRATATASRLIILLSPLLARTTPEHEDEVLADVRVTGDLAALLHPVDLERGGAT
jgi:hypothetical protein